MDIGQRIRQARLAQGITMRELGNRVGVSAAAISKYESGKDVPRPSAMIKLARELRVRSEFFTRKVAVSLVRPAFREDRLLSARMREAVMARIQNDLEKYEIVESLYPEGRRPEFKVSIGAIETIEDAESAAEELRNAWGMGSGPISDLTGHLEAHGVRVLCLRGIPKFDGFSCWMDPHTPVIAYSTEIPGDRQRFSMAHELAHLALELAEGMDAEKVANRFAGALLVPRMALLGELGQTRLHLSVEELSILKRKYGLSMQSICRRAFETGIVKESVYLSIRRLFKERKWTKEEPGEPVPKECPARYSLLLLQAATEGLLTPSTASALGEFRPSKRLEVSGDALREAVESMVAAYRNDNELIAFTLLNTEDTGNGTGQSDPR